MNIDENSRKLKKHRNRINKDALLLIHEYFCRDIPIFRCAFCNAKETKQFNIANFFLKKNSYFTFLSYYPLRIWALETCNQAISKYIMASSFKNLQFVEDDE